MRVPRPADLENAKLEITILNLVQQVTQLESDIASLKLRVSDLENSNVVKNFETPKTFKPLKDSVAKSNTKLVDKSKGK